MDNASAETDSDPRMKKLKSGVEIPSELTEKVFIHLMKNLLVPLSSNVPLLLGLFGPEFQKISLYAEATVSKISIDPLLVKCNELDFGNPEAISWLLKKSHADAANAIKSGKLSCVLILGFDHAHFSSNANCIHDSLINITRESSSNANFGSDNATRVPVIITGSRSTDFFDFLAEAGEMENYFWVPSNEHKIQILKTIFSQEELDDFEIAELASRFPKQSSGFFRAIQSRAMDAAIKKLLLEVGIDNFKKDVPKLGTKTKLSFEFLANIGDQILAEREAARKFISCQKIERSSNPRSYSAGDQAQISSQTANKTTADPKIPTAKNVIPVEVNSIATPRMAQMSGSVKLVTTDLDPAQDKPPTSPCVRSPRETSQRPNEDIIRRQKSAIPSDSRTFAGSRLSGFHRDTSSNLSTVSLRLNKMKKCVRSSSSSLVLNELTKLEEEVAELTGCSEDSRATLKKKIDEIAKSLKLNLKEPDLADTRFKLKLDSPPTNPSSLRHRRTFSDTAFPKRILLQQFTDTSFLRLSEEIGHGSSGIVSKCTIYDDPEVYACKKVRKLNLDMLVDTKSLRMEARALDELQQHSGVIGLYGLYEDKTDVYFLMEYCSGGDLFSRIKENKFLPEPQAAMICKTLASVLSFAHEKGIMHRDLKPENVLFVSTLDDTNIRLADFGSAAFFTPGQKLTDLVGSPMYIAPSVLSHSYGPEADLWSLGIVLYVMLTGLPPFMGSTNEEIFHNIKYGKLELENRRWKNVSEGAKSLVASLLVKDDQSRLTADQVLAHPWITSCSTFSMDSSTFPVAQLMSSQENLQHN